jgi:hypothetical protein
LFAGIAAQDLPAPYRSTIDALMFLDVIEHIEGAQGFLRENDRGFPKCGRHIDYCAGAARGMVKLRHVLWPLSATTQLTHCAAN